MAEVIENGRKNKKFKAIYKKSGESYQYAPTLEEECEIMDVHDIMDDIEDYISNSILSQSTQTVSLPPVIKYNKNWMLSVTMLASQLWCEKQVEFTLLTGRKKVTVQMKEGIKRHEELELEDHDLVQVEIKTKEDSLGIRFLNTILLIDQLLDVGKCRELWVFDTIGNYTFSGIIDQLVITKDKTTKEKCVVISDTKTRKTKKCPSMAQMKGASLQVQLYSIMLEDTKKGEVDFDKLYYSYQCDKNEPFQSEELKKEGCLVELQKKYLKAFKKLPKISDVIQLEYEYEGDVFSKSDVRLKRDNVLNTVNYLCNFWDGDREADHVNKSEIWKCKLCEFKDECTVSPLNTIKDE